MKARKKHFRLTFRAPPLSDAALFPAISKSGVEGGQRITINVNARKPFQTRDRRGHACYMQAKFTVNRVLRHNTKS
jgi:hypothetical protein